MGINKAFLELKGESLIKLVLSKIGSICQEVFVVVNDVEEYDKLDYPVLKDEIPEKGPLVGLLTGLKKATFPTCLAVAVDMPFINIPLFENMVDSLDSFEVAIPKSEKGLEPLHACYRKSCLPAIEKAVSDGQGRIISFFNEVNVKEFEPQEWQKYDPQGLFLFNINTKDDLQRAEDYIDSILGFR